jgi:hypothetical protein
MDSHWDILDFFLSSVQFSLCPGQCQPVTGFFLYRWSLKCAEDGPLTPILGCHGEVLGYIKPSDLHRIFPSVLAVGMGTPQNDLGTRMSDTIVAEKFKT